ncbi:MAG: ATP-binding protein [Opitutaceae bacterium]
MSLLSTLRPETTPGTGRGVVRDGAKNFRVLVIDDMPAIHADMRKILELDSTGEEFAAQERNIFGAPPPQRFDGIGFEIDSAFQGCVGVDKARDALQAGRPYAVAFVDMRMPPGDDGVQTIQALWRVDPEIQVVICSAYSDYSWEEIVAATGETDQLVILRKPFENIEVLQLAHALAKKWDLQRLNRQHVTALEALVARRTQELREKQAIFQLILENVTDLIMVVDASGKRIYNSPSFRAVLGLDPEALLRTTALEAIHPDDVATVERAIEQARIDGCGELVVCRMRHEDGSWRTLESCTRLVRDNDGQPAYFVVVARDITQRRELELKHQLGQKLESIGGLAAGIAHEINTPTQYITDNTRFLADAFRQLAATLENLRGAPHRGAPADAPPSASPPATEIDYLIQEIPRALQQNLEGLARVTRIVQSLKEFSHPNSTEKTSADLNRAILTAVAVCRHEWKYVAEVVTDLAPDLPPVPCLLDEFNQVMLNLIVNAAHTVADALKARGEKRGTITVRTRIDGDAALIEVSDTGMGISPQLRGRIFEPFFTTKEVGKGTGQGLAIVHTVVVTHHRGTVDFNSEVGRGSTFRLRLPLNPSTAGPAVSRTV